jgi:Photoprotection regulator fluorescence recovery protein
MWKIENYLRQQRQEIETMFDYRYSQLPFVFARLIHEGHLDESGLAGLSEEKRELIRSCLSLTERR